MDDDDWDCIPLHTPEQLKKICYLPLISTLMMTRKPGATITLNMLVYFGIKVEYLDWYIFSFTVG
ncbi:MAG: hypothetical protein IH840_06215 [Candidatus Heimdallarchaeota archaeon]|nr:hypothetical protein [Candidatus Heimdallarchaeota archaeon]